MRLVKLFSFSEMPNDVADDTFDLAIQMMGDNALDSGAFLFVVGAYSNEYDNASEKDKLQYDIEDVERDRKTTQWFIEQGCKMSEGVFLTR